MTGPAEAPAALDHEVQAAVARATYLALEAMRLPDPRPPVRVWTRGEGEDTITLHVIDQGVCRRELGQIPYLPPRNLLTEGLRSEN